MFADEWHIENPVISRQPSIYVDGLVPLRRSYLQYLQWSDRDVAPPISFLSLAILSHGLTTQLNFGTVPFTEPKDAIS